MFVNSSYHMFSAIVFEASKTQSHFTLYVTSSQTQSMCRTHVISELIAFL